MKRFLSLVTAIIMVFALALPVMATESVADTTSSVAETTDGATTVTAPTAIFSGETQKVKIPGSSTSFTAPSELKVVTFASPESELSEVGITRANFVANNYVFFAYSTNDEYPVYFQMTRSKDDYSKYIKDYKRLSASERQAMVDDALNMIEFDQYTYTQTQAYSDAEFTKYAGMQCLKTTAADTSSKTIEFSTVKNGYSYNIMYSYNESMAASDIAAIENMVNSLKVSNPVDVTSILLYVALALIVLLIAAFVMLYIRFTALNGVFMSMIEECECCDDECECCEHDHDEADEENEAEENAEGFDDSDFAEPYTVSDSTDDDSSEDEVSVDEVDSEETETSEEE